MGEISEIDNNRKSTVQNSLKSNILKNMMKKSLSIKADNNIISFAKLSLKNHLNNMI